MGVSYPNLITTNTDAAGSDLESVTPPVHSHDSDSHVPRPASKHTATCHTHPTSSGCSCSAASTTWLVCTRPLEQEVSSATSSHTADTSGFSDTACTAMSLARVFWTAGEDRKVCVWGAG